MPKKLDSDQLIKTLKSRFEKNAGRHPGIKWADVEAALKANPKKLSSLSFMEDSGGEPDVVAFDKESEQYTFIDCSLESPSSRRSLCYDRAGLEERKSHPPEGTCIELAKNWGVELITEDDYFNLQQLGEFDTKTSSWLATPPSVRKLGGAIFGDRRYNRVFVYHNSAGSYYAARGFRAKLIV